MPIFIVSLFKRATGRGNPSVHGQMDEQAKPRWHIYNGIFSALKRKETLT